MVVMARSLTKHIVRSHHRSEQPRPLTFPLSCLAALLLTVILVVLSPDNHIGTRLAAGATMMGGFVWGLVLGGIVLTLARLATPDSCSSLVGCGPHTAVLCCLGLAALAALVTNRAALGPPHPPTLWVAGMVSVLGFGLTLIAGQHLDRIGVMWKNVVGALMLSNALGFGFSCAVSVAVLPSLAADEMRGDAAAAIRGIGHAASAWSRVLTASSALLDRVAALECLAEDTRLAPPGGGVGPSRLDRPAGHSVLGDARLEELLGPDVLEPYRRVYGEVAACCAAMSAAVAASYTGSGSEAGRGFRPMGGWAASKAALHEHVRAALAGYWARVRAGAVAAGLKPSASMPALSGIEGQLHHHPHPHHLHHLHHPHQPHHPHQHAQARGGVRGGGKIPIIGLHQSRAMTFLWTVTEGVLDAVADLEAAVSQALRGGQPSCADAAAAAAAPGGSACEPPDRCSSGSGGTAPRRLSGATGEVVLVCVPGGDGLHAAAAMQRGEQAEEQSGETRPGVDSSGIAVRVGPDSEGHPAEVKAHGEAGPAATQEQQQKQRRSTRSGLVPALLSGDDWQWAIPLVKLTLGVPMLQSAPSLIAANGRLLLGVGPGGPAGRSALLASRPFQFGAKYWAATSAVLCLILGLSSRPELRFMRTYSMLYPFIATSVSMTERVESTLSRAALRAFGTVMGGLLGLAVMVHPPLAESGPSVLAIVCAVTFLTGSQFGHRLLYGLTLTLITLQSLALAHVASRGLLATAALLRRHGREAEAEELEAEAAEQERKLPEGGPEAEAGRSDAAGGSNSAATAAAAPSAAADTAALQALVSGPLVAVQTSLMKDTAVWTRGIYATPVIVPAVLRCCLLLSERLGALTLVVADTSPPVEGRLSGWAFGAMVLPLHADMLAMLDVLDRVMDATARLLDPAAAGRATEAVAAAAAAAAAAVSAAGGHARDRASREQPPGGPGGRGSGGKAEAASPLPRATPPAGSGALPLPPGDPATSDLEAAINELDQRRLQMRQSIHDMRRAFHAGIRAVDEQHLPYATHPGDTIRVNAMLYALVKVMDKATAAARTTLEFHRRRRRRVAMGAAGASSGGAQGPGLWSSMFALSRRRA
ncbi:hypothetical protein GPECTOR_46g247 [Gonium pectorale]|uniref:Uncharacterized protein n=1 Tax=Gonium pectorale TaxID=33097 RepID=A0A150G8M8_GONPE|nr:hypothetical protein GPECTOR_46g247 [Gonium pectorale]|eukprot:KXZ46178.1 hypothetical protein GPECTOR_46g247 [Gonium pectorale]